MITNQSIPCTTVREQIDAFIIGNLNSVSAAFSSMNKHIARCDECQSLFTSKAARRVFDAQIEIRVSENLRKSQESLSLPKTFISVFPEGMKVTQLRRYAAATKKKKKDEQFWQLVQAEYVITVSQPEEEDTAIVGVSIANDVTEKYEHKPIVVACANKEILLLKGRVTDGQLSANSSKTFAEIMNKLPLFFGYED